MLSQGLLSAVDEAVDLVLGLNDLSLLGIGLGVGLGIGHHPLNVVVGQTSAGSDDDVLLLSGALVLGGHIEDAIGINVEGDLDLGNTTRSRRNTDEVELAEILVVGRHLSLALHDLDLDLGLVVHGRGEGLRLLGGDGGVAGDKLGHDTAKSFNTKTEGSDVEKQDILDVSLEDTALDGGTHGNDFSSKYENGG